MIFFLIILYNYIFQGAHLVNIARGGLIDYEAVVKHLESGHLGGLGTDVAWTEPFDPQDKILKFNNVIMTPHIAGVTEHSYRSMAKVRVAISYAPFFQSILILNIYFRYA